jgi:hypothetical protein
LTGFSSLPVTRRFFRIPLRINCFSTAIQEIGPLDAAFCDIWAFFGRFPGSRRTLGALCSQTYGHHKITRRKKTVEQRATLFQFLHLAATHGPLFERSTLCSQHRPRPIFFGDFDANAHRDYIQVQPPPPSPSAISNDSLASPKPRARSMRSARPCAITPITPMRWPTNCWRWRT